MNSQSPKEHIFTSHTLSPEDTNQKILELSQEALEYAEHEFGVGHPIWQSIHDQVACFCSCAENCANEKSSTENFKRRKPTH